MGLLNPLIRNAKESQDEVKQLNWMFETTIENLIQNRGALVNNNSEYIPDKTYFFLPGKIDDPFDMPEYGSLDEIQEDVKDLKETRRDIVKNMKKSELALKFAEEHDLEPRFDNPLESWEEIDDIENKLSRLPTKLNEKLEIDNEMDYETFEEFEFVYSLITDHVDALPIIEGVAETQKNIQKAKDDLLKYCKEEYDRVESDYDRVSLPTEPVDWEEIIKEQNLEMKEYFNVEGIATATQAYNLHNMMEETIESIEGVESEYPLHVFNKGDESDTVETSRTPRPDALDDLFVYDFKHMPKWQERTLEETGDLIKDEKFIKNVKQVNGYLHDTDLPLGILVYVSTDMEIQEYVVEKHSITHLDQYKENFEEQNYSEKFLTKKENYDFENILKETEGSKAKVAK